jgi:hypothetical protein
VKAALSINREVIVLYWSFGRDILTLQKLQDWGAKIVDRVAADLSRAFPEMTGFRVRNVRYMRVFAESYTEISARWPTQMSS